MEANLLERLNLLYDSGQIDPDVYEQIPVLVQRVEEHLQVKLDEEIGGPFISHLSIALQRVKKQEAIQEAPEELKALSAKHPDLFGFAKEILNSEEEAEAHFVTLYFCTLTGKGNE